MSVPNPAAIVGTLKFNNVIYYLLNYVVEEEITKKVVEFRKKMNIKILPFYPHIQNAIQYDYEIIDDILYLTNIRFKKFKLIKQNEPMRDNEKSYPLKEILGEDRVECSFVNKSLKAITKKNYFNIENQLRLQINFREFYFKNGKLQYIKDKFEFIKHSRSLFFLNKIIEIEKDSFNIGLFFIYKKEIYSVAFNFNKFEGTKKVGKYIKSNMTSFEFFTLLTQEYDKLKNLKYNDQIIGEVVYNTKKILFAQFIKKSLQLMRK